MTFSPNEAGYFYASATKHLGIGMSVGLSVGRSVGFDTTLKKVQNVFI